MTSALYVCNHCRNGGKNAPAIAAANDTRGTRAIRAPKMSLDRLTSVATTQPPELMTPDTRHSLTKVDYANKANEFDTARWNESWPTEI